MFRSFHVPQRPFLLMVSSTWGVCVLANVVMEYGHNYATNVHTNLSMCSLFSSVTDEHIISDLNVA